MDQAARKSVLLLLTSRKKRGKAPFLLYYAEEEVCDIFETLPQNGDDFETAKEKLTEYFDHKRMSSMKFTTFGKRNRIIVS